MNHRQRQLALLAAVAALAAALVALAQIRFVADVFDVAAAAVRNTWEGAPAGALRAATAAVETLLLLVRA